MPPFCQRFRHSLRRNSCQSLQANPAIVPQVRQVEPQVTNQSDNDEDFRAKRRSSSPTLPVIGDRGPPTFNRYGNEDMFWNSIMVEGNEGTVGGVHRPWIPSLDPEKLRPEDEYTPRSRLPKHGPYNIAHSNRLSEDMKGHGKQPSASRPSAVRRRTHVSLGPRSLKRSISYGRERADNDLTVMFQREPDHSHVQAGQSQRERQLSPAPANISDPYNYAPPSLVQQPSVLAGPAREIPGAYPEELILPRPLTAIQEERNSPQVLHAHSSPRSPSSSTSVNSTTLTWNLCLNKILYHEAVDPEIKQRVKERVQRSHTTNGDGVGAHFYVAAAEAGLVPNFSYPVAGGSFYNREVHEVETLTRVADLVTADQVTGGDDAEEGRNTPRVPPQSQGFDFDFGFDLPDGIPTPSSLKSYRSTSPSNNSGSPTSDFLSRQTTPANPDVTRCLNTLLTEVLGPSEVNLLNSIIASSTSPLPSAQTTTTPNIPLVHTRLAHSLYTLLHHLQDRTTHLENTLLPQLGTALERKTFTIDVLSIEIRNLSDRITEVKTAVDFASKIVAGCWVREYEMMRILTDVQNLQSFKTCGVWRRVFGCRSDRTGLGCGSEGEDRENLTKREVDALVLMAEQNVKILREDVDDMVERVEKCKRRFVAYPAVECGVGSWRDV
jgi:hypothetical protein